MKTKTGRNFIVLLLLLVYLHATAVQILHIPKLNNHSHSGAAFNRRLLEKSHTFIYVMARTAKILAEQRRLVFQSISLCLLFGTFLKNLYNTCFFNLKWHNISILETLSSHRFLSLGAFRI